MLIRIEPVRRRGIRPRASLAQRWGGEGVGVGFLTKRVVSADKHKNRSDGNCSEPNFTTSFLKQDQHELLFFF